MWARASPLVLQRHGWLRTNADARAHIRQRLKINLMANLTLVYGMRLLPSDEVAEVGDATLKLKNGREAHVTMHVLEGSKEEIEKQLQTSLEAFFDFYPEI